MNENSPNSKSKVIVVLAVILVVVISVFVYIYKASYQPTRETKLFSTVIPKNPIPVNSFDISFCHPNPDVAVVKVGSVVEIVNKSKIPHTILFDAKHFYVVPASSSTKVTFKLYSDEGPHFYACDKVSVAGAVYLVK